MNIHVYFGIRSKILNVKPTLNYSEYGLIWTNANAASMTGNRPIYSLT